MKKRHIILGALAVFLILSSTIGISMAYFTTYVTAKGGYVIKSEPKIDEEFTNRNKAITISNKPGASPVFVRVKAFSGSEYEIKYSHDENWIENQDGYFYYKLPLEGSAATSATSTLNAYIEKIPERLKDNDEFNIVVIYESVLAVYKSNGDPDLDTSWANGTITKIG